MHRGRHLPPLPPLPDGWRFAGLRSLFFAVPEAVLATAARASQIVEWDRTHRFCGVCGTRTHDKPGDRAKECPACGHVAFPRVSPAMMVLVTRGRDVLLARANRFPVAMYSALAGLRRAGRDDRGLHPPRGARGGRRRGRSTSTYFGSQSWSFPHSLMIAFTAEYAGGELAPDGIEIADAQWFSPEAVPKLPPSVSIARRLIDATVARLARMPARP